MLTYILFVVAPVSGWCLAKIVKILAKRTHHPLSLVSSLAALCYAFPLLMPLFGIPLEVLTVEVIGVTLVAYHLILIKQGE